MIKLFVKDFEVSIYFFKEIIFVNFNFGFKMSFEIFKLLLSVFDVGGEIVEQFFSLFYLLGVGLVVEKYVVVYLLDFGGVLVEFFF